MAIQLTTTKRDDNDLVGGWRGGGEEVRWLLHQAAVDRPAAEGQRHCQPA